MSLSEELGTLVLLYSQMYCLYFPKSNRFCNIDWPSLNCDTFQIRLHGENMRLTCQVTGHFCALLVFSFAQTFIIQSRFYSVNRTKHYQRSQVTWQVACLDRQMWEIARLTTVFLCFCPSICGFGHVHECY